MMNKYEKGLERICILLSEIISCPKSELGIMVRDCENECRDQIEECWKEFFLQVKEGMDK